LIGFVDPALQQQLLPFKDLIVRALGYPNIALRYKAAMCLAKFAAVEVGSDLVQHPPRRHAGLV
jgi:hypothetical protein